MVANPKPGDGIVFQPTQRSVTFSHSNRVNRVLGINALELQTGVMRVVLS
jgi:hypothetical protein